jgi:hypothetical protein
MVRRAGFGMIISLENYNFTTETTEGPEKTSIGEKDH